MIILRGLSDENGIHIGPMIHWSVKFNSIRSLFVKTRSFFSEELRVDYSYDKEFLKLHLYRRVHRDSVTERELLFALSEGRTYSFNPSNCNSGFYVTEQG